MLTPHLFCHYLDVQMRSKRYILSLHLIEEIICTSAAVYAFRQRGPALLAVCTIDGWTRPCPLRWKRDRDILASLVVDRFSLLNLSYNRKGVRLDNHCGVWHNDYIQLSFKGSLRSYSCRIH